MAKSNTQISIDPEILKEFTEMVGHGNRSAKIQKLMEKFIKRHKASREK